MQKPQPQSGCIPRVLVVEDDPLLCKIAELQLAQYDLDVHIVNNGKEAVEAARTRDYALILMDVCMPVMNGLEAVKRIRQSEQVSGKHTRIVAVTSLNCAVEARDAGTDDYITKPANYQSIVARWLPDCTRKKY